MAYNDDNFWNDDYNSVTNSANFNARMSLDHLSGKSRLKFIGNDESIDLLKQPNKSARSITKSPSKSAQISIPRTSEPYPIYDATQMDSLAEKIRELGNIQPNYENLNFTSDELIKLKELLDDALDELSISKGDSLKFKQCTRCNKEFNIENNTLMECRKHSGFFIEDEKHENQGRWVI